MPRRGGRHYVVMRGAENAMEAFRNEIASDLGLADKIGRYGNFKSLTTEEVGQIGGEMVRRVQLMGEMFIKDRYEKGEHRLMPVEALPAEEDIRETTNNGNPAVTFQGTVHITPGSGQQNVEAKG